MHVFIPRPPDPLQVMSHAEQLAQHGGGTQWTLVFQGITAVSLGVVTSKMLFDMIHQATQKKNHSGKPKPGRER